LSVFVNVLVNLIFFKKAFLEYGLYAVWQNIPTELLFNFFKDISVIDIISGIGTVPLFFGVLGFTLALFKGKRKYIYLLSALILTDLLLLLVRLITFPVGIMFLGILLVLISAIAFESISNYVSMTKFSKYKDFLRWTFIFIVLVFILVPAYSQAQDTIKQTVSDDEVRTLKWIKQNTAYDSVILSNTEEGNYITAIANRKNVADSLFLLAPTRYDDVTKIFKTESLVQATNLLNKYNVDFIYLSEKSKRIYNITELSYTKDDACFKKIYDTKKTTVYGIFC